MNIFTRIEFLVCALNCSRVTLFDERLDVRQYVLNPTFGAPTEPRL